uniref:5-oxoprolinase n=1 Tax=Palpitomonas bilix TaxID=652834 RepID=A0A7S3G9C2_9EUKA
MTREEIALGFLKVANEAMCRPIRSLTQARGFDTSNHVLACFGGAGGQHACAIARSLGIRRIFVHRYSSILSAFGIGLADVVVEKQEPCSHTFTDEYKDGILKRLEAISGQARHALSEQGFEPARIIVEKYLHLRYEGTDTGVMTMQPEDGDYLRAFEERYKREFGFTLPDRGVCVDDIRARAIGKSRTPPTVEVPRATSAAQPTETTRCYFEGGWEEVGVFDLPSLHAGSKVEGPALIMDKNSTIVVEKSCIAIITNEGDVFIEVEGGKPKIVTEELDPVQLAIFSHRFMSIAEQCGRTLQRTSVSTNVKERLDFSCAIFGPDGGLVANAPHLPVHLGAMQEAVRYQLRTLGDSWKEGEVLMSNHPAAGGSHLPDITVITPVFEEGKAVFYIASRGHHADIGGIAPGSMPPTSTSLAEEGAAIKSFKLVKAGVFQEEGVSALLTTPTGAPHATGTRNLKDNLSDLKAQVAANQKGIHLMGLLIKQYGLKVVQAYMQHIQDNAEVAVRDMLKEISRRHKLDEVGVLKAKDYMDNGTPLALTLTIDRRDGSAVFDFDGTGHEVHGNLNTPPAVTASAVIYCLRCLVDREIPLNQGCLNPVCIRIPEGTILNPSETAAVVGGNVLTSQRIVDVILKAFGACAASQGCMNNLTFGDDTFGYYETIAGGAGAGPTWEGTSGVHTHMTNTRITDPEILEKRYPTLLREFSLRKGSGGIGRHKGGDGVRRVIEFLRPMHVGILSQRRAFQPYGMYGGGAGERGRNLLQTSEKTVSLGGNNAVREALLPSHISSFPPPF